MSRTSFLIISLIISLIMGACGYFMSGIFWFFVITALIFFFVSMFALYPLIQTYLDLQRRSHEAYKFIYSFIITLSVSSSFEKSFESGSEGLGTEFSEVINCLDGGAREKTFYLTNYFQQNIYTMFLNILGLYEEQGGDILALSRSLLLELARMENASNIKSKDGVRCIKEYVTMWVFSLIIFLFMRFGLSSFYDYLKTNIVFLVGIGFFLGFFLISILLYTIKYTNPFPKKACFSKKGA